MVFLCRKNHFPVVPIPSDVTKKGLIFMECFSILSYRYTNRVYWEYLTKE